jgi:2-octaprenyl-6-methoxyphenol hydroxylase
MHRNISKNLNLTPLFEYIFLTKNNEIKGYVKDEFAVPNPVRFRYPDIRFCVGESRLHNQHYDVIVVGAGLAGSSLAGALAAISDKRIAVLERSLPQAITNPNPQSRPISLSYGSQQVLTTLGWWEALSAHAIPINEVNVSQVGRMGIVDFKAKDFNIPALGYVIPYDYLHQQLYEVTAGNNQVDFIQVAHIDSIANRSGGSILSLRCNNEVKDLSTQLLLVADGADSDCRKLLGINSVAEDKGFVAISGELSLTTPHAGKALQRFSEKGVIAILPLSDPHRVQFVLSLTEKQKEAMKFWGKSRWLAFWQESLRGYLLVESQKITAEFKLEMQMATEVIRPGVVLLGNAAHTIYPLAAQGFNLTLRDVAALIELLVSAMNESPTDWASLKTLRDYADWREKDARQLKRFTQRLQSLFHLKIPGLDHLRGWGLMALDGLPGGKKNIGRWLLGLGGKVPKLARGVLPVQYKIDQEVHHDS